MNGTGKKVIKTFITKIFLAFINKGFTANVARFSTCDWSVCVFTGS